MDADVKTMNVRIVLCQPKYKYTDKLLWEREVLTHSHKKLKLETYDNTK